jgi:hypothetical protein
MIVEHAQQMQDDPARVQPGQEKKQTVHKILNS